MLAEFSRSLRREFLKRLNEKRYMSETIMLEYDMSVSIVMKQMEFDREKLTRSKHR